MEILINIYKEQIIIFQHPFVCKGILFTLLKNILVTFLSHFLIKNIQTKHTQTPYGDEFNDSHKNIKCIHFKRNCQCWYFLAVNSSSHSRLELRYVESKFSFNLRYCDSEENRVANYRAEAAAPVSSCKSTAKKKIDKNKIKFKLKMNKNAKRSLTCWRSLAGDAVRIKLEM